MASMVTPIAPATGTVRAITTARRRRCHIPCIPVRCPPSTKKVVFLPSEPDNHDRLLLLLQLALQVFCIEIIALCRVIILIEFALVEDIDKFL